MASLETGGNGNATPAPAPAFGGPLFSTQKPAENKDAPKPGMYESLGLHILAGQQQSAATSGGLFGGTPSASTTAGGLFGVPPKPAGDSSTTATTPATGGFFSLPPKPVDSVTTSTSTTTPALGAGLFGVKKPEAPGTLTPVPPAAGGFSLGGTGGTGGGGLFGATATNKDAAKPEEKKDAVPTTTTNLFGPPKDCTTTGTSTATSGSTLGGLFGKPAEKKDAPAGDYTSLLSSSFSHS